MKSNFFIFWMFIACGLLSGGYCFGQWSGTPFDPKVFVENKGQFPEETVFKAKCGAVNVHFTKKGLSYRYDEAIIRQERENEGKKEKESKPRVKQHVLGMQWIGCNPAVEILADDRVSFYYSYSFDPQKERSGLRAGACRKIIYRNLYPNIDVEYILPEKGGVKYSFILHPGADASLIRMKWSERQIFRDASGNMLVKSSFGDFTDHAPETYYSDGGRIPSSFVSNGSVVSFLLSPYDKNKTVILDPWTTNPNFTGYNAGYDVDYDFAGNVYAYGGDGWNNPFEEIKFNSAGAIQWVFVTSVFTSSAWYSYVGDFAVDGYSQSSYIAEGMNTSPGSRVLKVDPAGTQIASNPGSNLKEIWRMAYNSCTKQGVLGGSGWNQNYEAAVFDTTLAVISPVHMLGPQGLQDLDLLAIDNSNNCFMGFGNNGSSANNQLLKCQASTLLPTSYLVGNHFELAEISSQSYVNNSTGSNGLNGIAVNSTDLFTYNGYKVKRHNKNTGAPVDSAKLTPPSYAFFSNTLLIYWGGIAVDECNNIFVGSHDTIYQLDINLNKVAAIKAPGTVYDLKLSPTSNLIYATGKNFVASLTTGVSCNNMTISALAAGSCSASSATVTATGGSAPYTYQWSPGGQTTQVATGLPAGTYTVTVSDNSCPPIIQTATVTITSGALTATVSSTSSACLTSNGSATVTPTGGTLPFTYSWSPTGGNNASASGLAPGAYTVTVTDATGCSGTYTVAVSASGAPSVTVTSQNILCNGGNSGSASASATSGTMPYTYLWSGGQTTSSVSNLPAGNYSVVVTDASGCTQPQVVTLTQPAALTTSVATTAAACGSSNGTAVVSVSGGTGAFTYVWSPGGQSTAAVTGLAAGTYSVTVTDASGCSQVATSLLTSSGGPTASVSANVTISSGSSTTLSAGGGGTYAWSNGESGSPIIVAPTVTTIYCVTVTDVNNCIDTGCVTVYVASEPGTSCALLSSEDAFVLPSAFSPNADGQNDTWKLLYPPLLIDCIAEFTVVVYSRWGEKVFEGTDLAFSWDGKYKEKIEDTAVFGYYLEGTMKDGTKIKRKGNVSLLR